MSILELIFLPVFSVVGWMFSIVPRLIFPESFTTAVELLVSLIGDIGFFIPLGTLVDILLLYLSWYFVKLGVKLFMFLIRKVPILNIN